MEYLWNIYGISMEYLFILQYHHDYIWDHDNGYNAISMEYLWNIHGMMIDAGEPIINHSFGNSNHTTYKNGDDWGMVQMALFYPHEWIS